MFRALPAAQRRAARAHLRAGGVLAYATESCFGLGCLPGNAHGLRTILRLKGRPNHKGMIVVGRRFADLRRLVRPVDAAGQARLMARWPGPTTFLLPADRRVLPLLRGRHRTLAVRVSAHRGVAMLTRDLGPLVSTSANFAGKVSLKNAAACRRTFGQEVMVLPGRTGRARRPSAIIDFASGRVLR
ncbi:L-threonylcarbamoyladenylate synthase [Laribacter hongkongensis]|uniref:L-threonylcarbamoyladenylate synthase n=1 Tax=Laribacter hongkongensis TaxID=168471 RepID=UPI001EFE27CA|nr:L-threonylcarbamoyladenylate synthase [Laribacter hongkongensis]MCG9064811.1 L-threonylcarbamoyladenylate synthase [Laribacter hongkongensis]MCG9083616.1 L-threonylcarbamoyladenylate synthase [Laribacter hongkongensis]